MAIQRSRTFDIGDRLTVTIEKVAHGGHFVARHEGQVLFVRHAIPGEVVEVEITSAGANFLRADAISVINASPDRVVPPCRFSLPGLCGGCDFQHISLPRQRQLKRDVIKEQFLRLAKIEVEVVVEEVGIGDSDGLHWRTRTNAASDEVGRLGFYAARTNQVIAVDGCLISSAQMQIAELAKRKWPARSRVEISISNTGEQTVALAPAGRGSKSRITTGTKISHEVVLEKSIEVSQGAFWQSHSQGPALLSLQVRETLRAGDHVLDLYAGVGLFSAAALDLIGETGQIDLIESSRVAIQDAQRNFSKAPNVRIHAGDVALEVKKLKSADVVVLDPPREGAGKAVLESVARLAPRTILYIACDPASLARDSAYLSALGYAISSLRAFDLFPMTHHVECVARFEP